MLLIKKKAFRLCVVLLLWWCLSVSCDENSSHSYFPPDVKICSAKDPNLGECFTSSANKMLKHLASGIRSLNAVPMDPLHVPLMALERNNSIFPSLAFNVTDTVHNGWKDTVVLRSKINLTSHEFHFVLYFPYYHVRGLYEMTGSIIGIPLEGQGDFEVHFANSTCAVTVRGRLEERDGQDFFAIDNATQKSHYGKFEADFRNLFNNTALSNVTNSFINHNYRAFLDASTPWMDEVYSSLYVALVQRIFDRVPFRAMFTDLSPPEGAAEAMGADPAR